VTDNAPLAFDDTVACIWVRVSGTRMQLSVDSVTDRIPYERPLLVRALRALADSIEHDIAAIETHDHT
jgi:hypothetical protein